MSRRLTQLALCRAVMMLIMAGSAQAHEIVGNRSFPATLAIDDPGVADELAFPTFSAFKTGDDPSVRQHDISGEYSKRITEDFAVSFGTAWSHIHAPGGPGYPNRNIKPGTLDDTSWLIPTIHFWTRSAQSWVRIPEGVTRYETQPSKLHWVAPSC